MHRNVETLNGPCSADPIVDQPQTGGGTSKPAGSRGTDTVIKPKS